MMQNSYSFNNIISNNYSFSSSSSPVQAAYMSLRGANSIFNNSTDQQSIFKYPEGTAIQDFINEKAPRKQRISNNNNPSQILQNGSSYYGSQYNSNESLINNKAALQECFGWTVVEIKQNTSQLQCGSFTCPVYSSKYQPQDIFKKSLTADSGKFMHIQIEEIIGGDPLNQKENQQNNIKSVFQLQGIHLFRACENKQMQSDIDQTMSQSSISQVSGSSQSKEVSSQETFKKVLDSQNVSEDQDSYSQNNKEFYKYFTDQNKYIPNFKNQYNDKTQFLPLSIIQEGMSGKNKKQFQKEEMREYYQKQRKLHFNNPEQYNIRYRFQQDQENNKDTKSQNQIQDTKFLKNEKYIIPKLTKDQMSSQDDSNSSSINLSDLKINKNKRNVQKQSYLDIFDRQLEVENEQEIIQFLNKNKTNAPTEVLLKQGEEEPEESEQYKNENSSQKMSTQILNQQSQQKQYTLLRLNNDEIKIQFQKDQSEKIKQYKQNSHTFSFLIHSVSKFPLKEPVKCRAYISVRNQIYGQENQEKLDFSLPYYEMPIVKNAIFDFYVVFDLDVYKQFLENQADILNLYLIIALYVEKSEKEIGWYAHPILKIPKQVQQSIKAKVDLSGQELMNIPKNYGDFEVVVYQPPIIGMPSKKKPNKLGQTSLQFSLKKSININKQNQEDQKSESQEQMSIGGVSAFL